MAGGCLSKIASGSRAGRACFLRNEKRANAAHSRRIRLLCFTAYSHSRSKCSDLAKFISPRSRIGKATDRLGCPSIRAKALSSDSCPWRCVSTAFLPAWLRTKHTGELASDQFPVEPIVPPGTDRLRSYRGAPVQMMQLNHGILTDSV